MGQVSEHFISGYYPADPLGTLPKLDNLPMVQSVLWGLGIAIYVSSQYIAEHQYRANYRQFGV